MKERSLQIVNTRDSFKMQLTAVETPLVMSNGRVAVKTREPLYPCRRAIMLTLFLEWFFPKDIYPPEYDEREHGAMTEHGLPTGVVTYNNICSPDDLRSIEREADALDLVRFSDELLVDAPHQEGRNGKFSNLPNTRHETTRGQKIVRTKV